MTYATAIIAPGRMGSALATVLARSGHEVVTLLDGRGDDSCARAHAAGMRGIAAADLPGCDLILSVLPPTEAVALARQVAQVIENDVRKPVYVDLNAISPQTAAAVAAALAGAGCGFADGCIIGTAPADGYEGPYLYLSGSAASQAAAMLAGTGLLIEVLDAPAGAASALKMCFAGIMKGLTSLGFAMFGAAARADAAPLLAAQLARSQPDLWAWFCRQMPASHIKQDRWVGEMHEIAAFLTAQGDLDGAAQFRAHAAGFASLVAGTGARHLDPLFGKSI